MAWFVRRNLFAGVAGACVVGLGIVMVLPIFSRYGDTRLFTSPHSHRPSIWNRRARRIPSTQRFGVVRAGFRGVRVAHRRRNLRRGSDQALPLQQRSRERDKGED